MKNVKKEIKKGNSMLGIFISLPSPQLVEMAAFNGYDFVIIDGEHGTGGVNGETENMIIAAYASGIYPIVRVPNLVMGSILQPLDMGAKGIHVPLINTKEQTEKAVKFSKYPPIGNRGVTFSTRAAKYGFSIEKGRKLLDKANEDTLITIAIETKESVSNLDDILLVPGIDVAFIGAMDLSVSLGYPGDVEHPVVVNTIKQIISKTHKAGVQVGILFVNSDQAKRYIAQRVTYLTVSGVGILNKGLQWIVREIKG